MSLLAATFTHVGATGALPRLLEAGPTSAPAGPFLASSGRLIAVGTSLSAVSFFDSDNVAELESALGTGSCKFKLLGNLDLLDAGHPLAIRELHFLAGGSLAVVGQSTGRNKEANTHVGATVIHVYELLVSATAPISPPIASSSPYISSVASGSQGGSADGSKGTAGQATFNTALGRLHAPEISISVLPRLVYRSYLPGVRWARLIPHPTMSGVFGVLLPNDNRARFYTAASGAAAGTSSPGLTNGSGGDAVTEPSSAFLGEITGMPDAPLTHGLFSRDGSLFACASSADSERHILIFACGVERRRLNTHIDEEEDEKENEQGAQGEAKKSPRKASKPKGRPATATTTSGSNATSADPSVFTNGGVFPAECIARFQCESPVTALSFAVIPAPKDSCLFERFLYNNTVVLSGHANGFLNVWWLGNRHFAAKGARETGLPRRVPPPRVMTWGGPAAVDAPSIPLQSEPIGSYPPFHASRGAITFISAGVTADEGRYGQEPPPSLFTQGSAGGGGGASSDPRYPTTVTLVCVGAEGAKGWRLYTFEHTASLPSSSSLSPPGGHEVEQHATLPDYLPGHYAWDHKGRRSYVPPTVRNVRHLLSPCVRLPSYAECLRAPIVGVGAAGGAGWRTGQGIALPSTPISLASSASASSGTASFPSYPRPQPTGLIYPPDGESPSASASSSSSSSSSSTLPSSVGTKPLGCSVLIRHPCADDRFQTILPRLPLPRSRSSQQRSSHPLHGIGSLLEGPNASLSDFDDSVSAAEFAANLLCVPPSQLIAGPTAHRLLARAGVASHSFVDPASFIPIPSPYAASLELVNSQQQDKGKKEEETAASKNVAGLSQYLSSVSSFLPSPPPARYMEAPRLVFLLLNDYGLHATGADYHQALVTEISPAIRAAAALERVRKRKAQQKLAAEEAERLAAAELAATSPAVVVTAGGSDAAVSQATVVEDDAVLKQQREKEREERRLEAEAAAMVADEMIRAVAAAVSEGAAQAASEAPAMTTLPNPLTEAASSLHNDGTALPSRFGLATGVVVPPPLPQADLVATIRARSYWPSAAVSSVVRGTRNTFFDDVKKKQTAIEPPASSPTVAGPSSSSSAASAKGLPKRPIQRKVDIAARMATTALSFAANAAAAAASAEASAAVPTAPQPAAVVDARLSATAVSGNKAGKGKSAGSAAASAAPVAVVVPPVLPKHAAYLPPHSRARLLKKLGLLEDGISASSPSSSSSAASVAPAAAGASTEAIGFAATKAAAGLPTSAVVVAVATSLPPASFNRVVKLRAAVREEEDGGDGGDGDDRAGLNATTFTAASSGITSVFGQTAATTTAEEAEEDAGIGGIGGGGAQFDLGEEEQPAIVVSPSSAHRKRQQQQSQAPSHARDEKEPEDEIEDEIESDRAPPQPRPGFAGIHPRRAAAAAVPTPPPPSSSSLPRGSPMPKDLWASPPQVPAPQLQQHYLPQSGALDSSFRSEITAATDYTDPDAVAAELELLQREVEAARARLARSGAGGRDRPAVESVVY